MNQEQGRQFAKSLMRLESKEKRPLKYLLLPCKNETNMVDYESSVNEILTNQVFSSLTSSQSPCV